MREDQEAQPVSSLPLQHSRSSCPPPALWMESKPHRGVSKALCTDCAEDLLEPPGNPVSRPLHVTLPAWTSQSTPPPPIPSAQLSCQSLWDTFLLPQDQGGGWSSPSSGTQQ